MTPVTSPTPQFTAPLLAPAASPPCSTARARPVVLDVRWRLGGPPGRADHEAGHVPGAVFVDLDTELAAPPGEGGRHPLPAPAALQDVLRRAGVSEGPGWSPTTTTPARSRRGRGGSYAGPGCRRTGSRCSTAGSGRGSRRACRSPRRRRERHRVTSSCVPAGCRSSTPTAPRSWPGAGCCSTRGQARAIGGRSSRSTPGPGTSRGPATPRRPSTSARTAVGFRRPRCRRATPHWASAAPTAGQPNRPKPAAIPRPEPTDPGGVGAYCGSGVNATAVVLALEYAGLRPSTRPAALYAGSWSQWSADPRRPVATGSAP